MRLKRPSCQFFHRSGRREGPKRRPGWCEMGQPPDNGYTCEVLVGWKSLTFETLTTPAVYLQCFRVLIWPSCTAFVEAGFLPHVALIWISIEDVIAWNRWSTHWAHVLEIAPTKILNRHNISANPAKPKSTWTATSIATVVRSFAEPCLEGSLGHWLRLSNVWGLNCFSRAMPAYSMT